MRWEDFESLKHAQRHVVLSRRAPLLAASRIEDRSGHGRRHCPQMVPSRRQDDEWGEGVDARASWEPLNGETRMTATVAATQTSAMLQNAVLRCRDMIRVIDSTEMACIRPPLLPASLLLGILIAGGCQSGPRPAAEFVQQAQYLHDNGLRTTIVTDDVLTGYFNDVGKRIVGAATAVNANNTRDPTLSNMRFHLVASDVVNAYGTGGGHIYIYNGLLQLCESEEELAAIMAVQYAHALDLDVQKTGMRPIVNAAADPFSVSRVVFLFVNAPLSGTQCLAADRRAFEIYARAGWDPARFPEIYERLQIRGYNVPPSVGSDGQPRPSLSSRANVARGLRQTLPPQARDWKGPTVAGAEDFKSEVKARAAQLSQRLASSPDRGFLYLAAFPNVILPAELSKQQQAQGQLRQELTPPAPTPPRIEPS